MAATVARGSHNMNSMYIKPMLRKAYHKKGGADLISDAAKLTGEEVKNKGGFARDADDNDWWVPDHRTGIFYPKGKERVIGDVPPGAGKDYGVNWFSSHEDYFN